MEQEVGKRKSTCMFSKARFVKYGLILGTAFKLSISAAQRFPHLSACFSDFQKSFLFIGEMTAVPDTFNVCNHPVVPFI